MDRHLPAGVSALRRAREDARLSPEGLAYKAGVSLRTIERIEAGHVKHPHRATLNVLAAALEIAPEQLLGEVTPA